MDDRGADADPARGARRRWLAVGDALVPDEDPAGGIYGMMIVGTLFAAEAAKRETWAQSIGAAVLVLAAYWLAHSYADLGAKRLRQRRVLPPREIADTLVHHLSILKGATLPLLALAIAWAAGGSVHAGVLAALWTSAGGVVVLELIAGLRIQARGWDLVSQGLGGVAMGLVLIAVKAIV